ncbi:MAG: hypothetical protein ACKVOJ_07590 [Sphingomonadaceae bacterium]
MAKLIKWVVAAAVLIGLMIFLASRVGEQPLTRHVKAVPSSVLKK